MCSNKNTNVGQSSYSRDYTFNQPIAPNHLLDQNSYSGAPDLDSFALLGGNTAPNRFPVTPSVSGLTAPYVPGNGPWTSLSPDLSNPGLSVSGLTTPYVPGNGPWTSLSPDF